MTKIPDLNGNMMSQNATANSECHSGASKIIGISGHKQSGKTTAAKYLEDQIGAEIVCFSDELKDMVCRYFGANEDDLWGSDADKNKLLPCGKSGREVLQIVGTDWFRSLDPDWLVRAYKKKDFYWFNIITPDVRFLNEIQCIHDLGGIVIRLLRKPYKDEHKSETALDWLDGLYYNPPRTKAAKKVYAGIDISRLHFVDNAKMTIDEQNKTVFEIAKSYIEV